MEAKNLISDAVPSLRITDIGQKALNWMDVFKITHLAVVNGEEYVGLLSDKLIYDLNLTDHTFESHIGKIPTPHVHENQHIFEVASIMYKLKLSVVPVLNGEHVYQGVITLYDLARRFSNLYSVHEPGGVILLEINSNDYSLAQIAQIVESNNAKILSLFVNREYGSKNLLLTLKLNIVELSPVIQTFARYNFNVLSVYMDNSILNDLYEDRYDQFIKYMNI
ncbi:MAG: CBS domain-containing protein [Mariniphaga sp.]|nr:CBS domain-containing protein [Mariniphaga sp.]